jgi:hypothetical protein
MYENSGLVRTAFRILSLGLLWVLEFGCWNFHTSAETLPLPARQPDAATGNQFLKRISSLGFEEREREIYTQITSGNVPHFLRQLCPVEVTNSFNGRTNWGTLYATADYVAIGSDDDYYLAHMSPNTAQCLADFLNCTLPTPKIVDAVYRAAEVKLTPEPIAPSSAMTTVADFSNHNAMVWRQRVAHLNEHQLGTLVAGHQKDVVIASGLASTPSKAAIYGWHQTNGVPIQPLYLKHAANWVDYSQCIRLVSKKMIANGEMRFFGDVIGDPELCGMVSDEGRISDPRYPTNHLQALPITKAVSPPPDVGRYRIEFNGFQRTNTLGERTASFRLEPEVTVTINAPAKSAFSSGKKLLLIFYALPNGNSTEQTIGKIIWPGDDSRFDIQHIGAQTRFLRRQLTDRTLIVVYLENDLKSWPAWRKKHGDSLIPKIVGGIRSIFAREVELVLTGHSGGGSFAFGYMNEVESLPDEIVRIAFLDSNYGYDPALGHKEKLVNWLKARSDHSLCVLAYNDAAGLLNGKPFVSEAGGTWGKSHQMQSDLAKEFTFTSRCDSEFQRFTAQDGRIQFILKENPERKIFHTRQVELNGFIHAMLCGTPRESKGYAYFRDRAYAKWIIEEVK